MLILLFRGIFLIGILSWYSTNVWKMIDGYFKDSFEKYLQREYQKNPKMREDVNAYGLSGENGKGRPSQDSLATRTAKSTPNTNVEQRSCERLAALGEETCPIDSSSMEAAAGAQAGSGSLSPTLSAGDMTDGGHASKSEVSAKGGLHKNAYLQGSSRSSAAKTSEELPVKDIIMDYNDDDDDTFRSKSIVRESINIDNSHDNPIKSKTFVEPPVKDIIIDDDDMAKSMLVVRKSINVDDSYENDIQTKTTTAAKTFEESPVKDINVDDDKTAKSMLVARKSINNENSHDNPIRSKTSRATKISGELPVKDIIIDEVDMEKSMLVVRKSINVDDSYENDVETKTTTAAKTFEELPVKDINADDDKTEKSMLVVRKSINIDNYRENTVETETSGAAITKKTIRETSNAGIAAKKTTNRKSTLRGSSREQQKTEILEDKEKMKKKKKLKVKTITLTDEDFKQAKLRAGLQDYDFSEFDDDDNEGAEPIPEGILVSQLPFKPRADIGNLERVTHEEFCPLTLEDEANCGETKSWP